MHRNQSHYRFRYSKPAPKESPNDKIDVFKIIPFIYPLLVLLAVTRLIAYYLYFDINILNYLEFSEILTSFLGSIAMLIITIIILIFYTTWINRISSNPSIDNIRRKRVKLAEWTTLAMLLVIIIIWEFVLSKEDNMIVKVISFISYALIAVIFSFRNNSNLLRPMSYYSLFNTISLITLTLIFIVINFGLAQASGKDEEKIKHTDRIIFSDTAITTNNKLYYIGHTKSYIFIRNDSFKITSVYPMSDVKELHIKNDKW